MKGMTKEQLDKAEKLLIAYGYEADRDYYIDRLCTVWVEYAVSRVINTSEYEIENEGGIEFVPDNNREANVDLEFITETSRQYEGYAIMDFRSGDIIDLHQLKPKLSKQNCAVCGKRVKIRMPDGIFPTDDKRLEGDGLKCTDHIGVPVDSTFDWPLEKTEVEIGERPLEAFITR